MFRMSTIVALCNSGFRHVRPFLTHDASVLVDNALVCSRLDYCNSLFLGVSLSSVCINYSTSKIVQLESYPIPVLLMSC